MSLLLLFDEDDAASAQPAVTLEITLADKIIVADPIAMLVSHPDANHAASLAHALAGTPPRRAQLLLDCCLDPPHAEAVIGDLSERYPGRVARYGLRGARLWFWAQALRSIIPLRRWATWGAAFEILRRWLRG